MHRLNAPELCTKTVKLNLHEFHLSSNKPKILLAQLWLSCVNKLQKAMWIWKSSPAGRVFAQDAPGTGRTLGLCKLDKGCTHMLITCKEKGERLEGQRYFGCLAKQRSGAANPGVVAEISNLFTVKTEAGGLTGPGGST